MMKPAEGYSEFVAYFAPERAPLREFKMVWIRRTATAGETGLGAHELK